MDQAHDFLSKMVKREQRLIALRVTFSILAVVALILGFIGLEIYLPSPLGWDNWRRDLDLLYYDLQLFVLSANPVQGGPFPWQLNVARFLAPSTTAYAIGAGGLAGVRRCVDRPAAPAGPRACHRHR